MERWTEPVRGEVTLVLAPVEPPAPSRADAIERARSLVASGASVREAARAASDETGASRREVYEALVADQESS